MIVTIESNYGTNNFLLMAYLLCIFIFWVWVYFYFTKEFYFDKRDLLNSISNTTIKFLCWFWFLALFYVFFNSVLLISSGDTFLTDKVDLLYNLLIVTMIIMSVIGIFYLFKLFNKMTGLTDTIEEFIYEIRTGGRK